MVRGPTGMESPRPDKSSKPYTVLARRVGYYDITRFQPQNPGIFSSANIPSRYLQLCITNGETHTGIKYERHTFSIALANCRRLI